MESSQHTTVSFEKGMLLVDGKKLRANTLRGGSSKKLSVHAETLEEILIPNRRPILHDIEANFKGNVTPSVWTAQLGTTRQTDGMDNRVFTQLGYQNGGVNTTVDEIQEGFHGHWNAIKSAGFLPEVRRTSGGEDAGSWLLLRKPTLQQVALHWLGWQDTADGAALINARPETKDEYVENLQAYQVMGEKMVDHLSDTIGNVLRPRWQLGVLLGTVALKSNAGYSEYYEEDINDIFEYADTNVAITQPMVRAIENSTFGS